MKRSLSWLILLPIILSFGLSQTPAPRAQTTRQQAFSIASIVDREITELEKNVVAAAQAMPEAKFDYIPAQLNTKDSRDPVRSFSSQVKHLANANYALWSPLTGEALPAGMEGPNGPEKLKAKAEVIKYLKDSFALGHKAAATLTAENSTEIVKTLRGPEPRLYLATFALQHGNDHYGQLALLLRMNGITPPASAQSPDLGSVLAQMDEAAKNFKSAEADVELTQYTKIVDDTSKQTGHVFFRWNTKNKSMDVALRLVTPQPKQVVVSGDSFSYFDSKTGQCSERKIGDHRADVETMMNLGFGGRGQELLRDFDVKLAGWETVDNIQTARLELVPKSDSIKQFFTRAVLWIDPKRDVPLKQQRFEVSGDYQLTHYTNIRVPGSVPSDVFRLKNCGKE